MKAVLKKVAASLAITAMILPTIASATVWLTPGGPVSDTCVAPGGEYMVFANMRGYVGTGCSFSFYGNPTIYYGTWR